MALLRAKTTEIPTDAVILSKDEALNYQIKLLNNWKHSSDVFAYKYGSLILSSVSAGVGFYINSYYRKKFRLLTYGRLSSYLPIVVLPAAMSFVFHTEFVLPGLILQDNCPVCLELRSATMQSVLGSVLPFILAPLSSLPLATQYATYNIPYITKEPMKVYNLWKTKTKPIGNILFAIFLGQALLGSAIAYFESRSIKTINEKLAKLEYSLEHSDINI